MTPLLETDRRLARGLVPAAVSRRSLATTLVVLAATSLAACSGSGQNSSGSTANESSAGGASSPVHPEDAFLGGTCTGAQAPTWLSAASCDGTWYENGSEISATCAASGEGYEVSYLDGHAEVWTWYLQTTTGEWVKAAALAEYTADGAGDLPPC